MTRSIRSPNAEFQVWCALRTNRQTRNRENAFLVEGVRNIDAAMSQDWPVRAVVSMARAKRSAWAASVIERAQDHVELSAPLFDDLTAREERPELLLVAEKGRATLADLHVDAGFVATLLDRPVSPGNIGTIIRTSDALGGRAVMITGHGADPYDPGAVRASTGSFFSVPIVELTRPDGLVRWATEGGVALVATDENGSTPLEGRPSPPAVYLFGNETRGLSRKLREVATCSLAIAMRGDASSLNVAAAHAIVLYAATTTSTATRRG